LGPNHFGIGGLVKIFFGGFGGAGGVTGGAGGLGGAGGGAGGAGGGVDTLISQSRLVVAVQPSSGGTIGGGLTGHLTITGGGLGLQPQELEQITVSETRTTQPPGPAPLAPV